MKRFLLFLTFLLVTAAAFCQATDTTATVTYNFGDSFMEFLEKNMWTLAFAAFAIISEWLGQTGKVKEGSIWAWVINMVGKLLKKKTEVVQTKKAKFIKPVVLIFALMLSGITLTSFAQPVNKFFRPVDKDLLVKMKANGAAVTDNHAWLIRPAVGVSAVQLYYDKTTKLWNATSLNAVGFGIGYQHFVQANDAPYNDYGFNALILLDAIPTEVSQTAISIAGTVSALQYVNMGAGYNLTLKKPFLLATVTFNFNK